MHHSHSVLPAQPGGPVGFCTERTDGCACGIARHGLWWRAADEQRVGRANRPVSVPVGARDEIELFNWIDFVVVAAKDHDAPAGPTDTNASPLCGRKVRDDILGAESAADLPAGRGPRVLCGYGAATGGHNIRVYNIVDHLQLFHELFDALGLDSYDSAVSNAGRNSVS